jgi:hypothetical protein
VGWLVICLLVAAVAVLLIPGPHQPDQVSFQGRKIRFAVKQMQKDPPRSFQALVALEPGKEGLPGPQGLLAVVRAVADYSLMRIGSVNQWWIGLTLAGQDSRRPFAVYRYQEKTGKLSVTWQPANLPPHLRGSLPPGGERSPGG